jgi:hypothetical protein
MLMAIGHPSSPQKTGSLKNQRHILTSRATLRGETFADFSR